MYQDIDRALALKLQKQLDGEVSRGFNSNKENKKGGNSNINENGSLVDPSWEYVDPTPDIHVLFMQFNNRFFWNKLKHVEVRWSPRMTSCAGVCCYEGRGGLCSVRLSLPLLKLRPRKDLVETLLHEMIHAYLFVTHNDRDRDGHGPEFHKHMYRINKEAGTNISVYHNFHEEVKSYQQHWWRCDGPCQNQPPFFGMVKRSMNRAPGPSDFWYEAHQRSCGGNYIKVREPESFGKKGAKKNVNHKDQSSGSCKGKDIRKYFPSNDGGNARNTTMAPKNLNSPKPYNRIGKVGESSMNASKRHTSSKLNNAGKGFIGGMLMNKGGGTLTVTAKGNKNRPFKQGVSPTKFEGNNSSNIRTITDLPCETTSAIPTRNGLPNVKTINGPISKMPSRNFVPFGGVGYTLGTTEANKHNPNRMLGRPIVTKNETSTGRNSALAQQSKRAVAMNSNATGCSSSKRSAFVTDPNGEVFEIEHNISEAFPTVNCPVCNVQLKEYDVNSHLDICLNSCEDSASGVDVVFIEDSPDKQEYMVHVSCPVCNLKTNKEDISIHLENCIGNVFVEESIDITDQDSDEIELEDITQTDLKFPCPSCSGLFEEKVMNSHLDQCLSDVF